MHNEYGLTWLDSVDVEAMSPTQVSRWTMYARYGFMELRIKEAVWRFESVYASIFDKSPIHNFRMFATVADLTRRTYKFYGILEIYQPASST